MDSSLPFHCEFHLAIVYASTIKEKYKSILALPSGKQQNRRIIDIFRSLTGSRNAGSRTVISASCFHTLKQNVCPGGSVCKCVCWSAYVCVYTGLSWILHVVESGCYTATSFSSEKPLQSQRQSGRFGLWRGSVCVFNVNWEFRQQVCRRMSWTLVVVVVCTCTWVCDYRWGWGAAVTPESDWMDMPGWSKRRSCAIRWVQFYTQCDSDLRPVPVIDLIITSRCLDTNLFQFNHKRILAQPLIWCCCQGRSFRCPGLAAQFNQMIFFFGLFFSLLFCINFKITTGLQSWLQTITITDFISTLVVFVLFLRRHLLAWVPTGGALADHLHGLSMPKVGSCCCCYWHISVALKSTLSRIYNFLIPVLVTCCGGISLTSSWPVQTCRGRDAEILQDI